MKSISLVLFDLGGVLLELGPSPIDPSWMAEPDLAPNAADWLASPLVDRYESGRMDSEEFFPALIKELKLNTDAQQLEEHFRQWVKGCYPETKALLSWLATQPVKLAMLSNSNPIHWPRILDPNDLALGEYFDYAFSSHQMGFAKPSKQAFECIFNECGVSPAEVVFFDDNQVNVDAAQELGINAWKVAGPSQIRHILEQL